MGWCDSLCSEYKSLSEPLDVCGVHLGWTGETGKGGGDHHAGVLPPSVCTCVCVCVYVCL